jgi:threonine dehydratase
LIERPRLQEIERAAEILRDVLVRTPLLPFQGEGPTADLLLKPESLQRVGSFKIRGVYHAVERLSPEERRRGISTVSAGNTAQALAWCGRRFGVPARSVMPETAPETKIRAVERWGGLPVLVPKQEVFRFLRERLWEKEPYAFIHPWIERNVMIGHATIGLEIIAEAPDVAAVYVPVGGGGLIGGVGSALRALSPKTRIVAVEPADCPALHESLSRGAPAAVDCRTICDGVAVPYIADEMFPLLREIVDDVRLVSEDAVRAAVRTLALRNRLIAEPSGALAVAAALEDPRREPGRTVCLVTGGSIDLALLLEILDEPPRA